MKRLILLSLFFLFSSSVPAFSLSLELPECSERDDVPPTSNCPEGVNFDFQALTVNRLEKKGDSFAVRSKIVHIFKDSQSKFKIDDEFTIPWSENSSHKPFHTLTFFYGQFDQEKIFSSNFFKCP